MDCMWHQRQLQTAFDMHAERLITCRPANRTQPMCLIENGNERTLAAGSGMLQVLLGQQAHGSIC